MLLILLLLPLFLASNGQSQYQPTWISLDSRPLPKWYDNDKIGVFFHWGLYSVPAFGSGEWFWAAWKSGDHHSIEYMKKNFRPNFTYQDFAPQFTAEFFDADAVASLVREAGARYAVLTTKHHEGFTMWPSSFSWNWNVGDLGPHRDITGELASALGKQGIRFGAYYSLYEWFNPLYIKDKERNFTTRNFVDHKMIPEMKELVENYKPEVIWVDGDWEATDSYFQSKEFLAWLYNESPVNRTVVVNDRWGKGIPCHHGGYFTCKDRFSPKTLQPHKFESAMTLDKNSWGYRRDALFSEFLTSQELIDFLVTSIACGGNLLVNAGPTHDGRIIPIFQERLRNMGSWLKVNGEAIYGTKPWPTAQNDTLDGNVWYTVKAGYLYSIALRWPDDDRLILGCPRIAPSASLTFLGVDEEISWESGPRGETIIQFPSRAKTATDWAWVIRAPLPQDAEPCIRPDSL